MNVLPTVAMLAVASCASLICSPAACEPKTVTLQVHWCDDDTNILKIRGDRAVWMNGGGTPVGQTAPMGDCRETPTTTDFVLTDDFGPTASRWAPTYFSQTSYVFNGLLPGLPMRPMTVSLDPVRVRGTAQITEQPSDANDYTTTVTVNDPEGGADWYTIVLTFTYDEPSRRPLASGRTRLHLVGSPDVTGARRK